MFVRRGFGSGRVEGQVEGGSGIIGVKSMQKGHILWSHDQLSPFQTLTVLYVFTAGQVELINVQLRK